ncbi:MAG TPA: response regulator [Bacteriovoracaceae bacterium]|nr:response regulator [Bacteriovoracaceae bacterium]
MSSKSINNMNVLVVDDEEKIGELIKIFLQSAFSFNSVIIAPNVLQASQKCLNQEFDLMIIDHVMPGKPGLEYIEMLRSSLKFQKTKIILISGYLEQEDVLKAINLGVKNIIVKPFNRQQIISQVEEVLQITANI